jgi:alpha-glucosidase
MAKHGSSYEFFARLAGQSLVDDIEAYGERSAEYDARYAKTPKSGTRDNTEGWRVPGAVERIEWQEQKLTLHCEAARVELVWLAADCVRVRARFDDEPFGEPFSFAVHKTDWPPVQLEVVDGSDALEVRTTAFVYRIGKHPYRLGVETLNNQLVCVDTSGAQEHRDGLVGVAMRMHPQEASYGLGERAAALNLRGGQYQLWNFDSVNYDLGSDPLYCSIPFYLGVHDFGSYGVLWDNSARGLVDVGKNRADELWFEAETGELCYYLFPGSSIDAVLSRYTELTGRLPLPPMWWFGYQQCRWSYMNQDEVQEIAQGFRERRIPCDVLYLDIDYMDGYRVFTWSEQRFPDLPRMIRDVQRQGFRIVPILDPGIKIDEDYESYRTGLAQDVFVKYPDGKLFAAPVWASMSHFPDFLKEAARAWWREQCKGLLDIGIDGIWNDMCEPAIFTPMGTITLPDYVEHERDGEVIDHLEGHNVYGMLMGRASFEALREHRPDVRPVNMIRAGYAGAQRYATSWTGDNASTWGHLRLSISMTLNMGLSGSPLTGPDVGGFRGNADGELFTRWLQAACLMPLYRGHSALGTERHEPWAFGQPYEVINRLTINLRYRFLPYLYSMVAQAHERGWPVIRPLFTAEPDNPDLRGIDDCYLLGDAVLVAPVLEQGATERQVYLPAGEWYDYWSNEVLSGGQMIDVVAPLERLPLFIKAGSMLPQWPEMNYVGETEIEQMTYRVYPGEAETTLYEDDGISMRHTEGDYRWVYVTCGWEDETFIISRRTAGRYEPTYKSIRLEIVGLSDEPQSIRVDRKGAPLWFYEDGILELTLNSFNRIEIVQKPTTADRTILHRPW